MPGIFRGAAADSSGVQSNAVPQRPRYTAPMNATRLATIAFALALLAGCGNKGPLVLPAPPIDPATVPEEAPADAEPSEATPDAVPTDESAVPADATPPEAPLPADGDGNG